MVALRFEEVRLQAAAAARIGCRSQFIGSEVVVRLLMVM